MTDLFEPVPDEPATRRRQNTRSRLVHASLEVFVDKGIDGATIDDLVRAAGFTRGAFYSSFSKKEEVFYELFESVTEQVTAQVRAQVSAVVTEGSAEEIDESTGMVAIFEAIRPHGRQWYLLYSEAVAHALRSEEAREKLNRQRHRLRDEIAAALLIGMEAKGERSIIPVEQVAQILVAVYVDLMVQEQMDGIDANHIAGPAILRTLRAFVEPADT